MKKTLVTLCALLVFSLSSASLSPSVKVVWMGRTDYHGYLIHRVEDSTKSCILVTQQTSSQDDWGAISCVKK